MNDRLLDIAIATAIAAGQQIAKIYQEDDFDVEIKEDATPITRADKAAHKIIVAALAETGIPIVSEEGVIPGYEERKDWQQFWLVDPLDGTKEFVKKNGEFTVNIALIEKNIATLGVIYVPISETLYYGKTGVQAVKAQCKEGKIVLKQNLPLMQDSVDKYIVVASRSFKDADTEQYIAGLGREVEIVSRGSSLKLCMIAEGSADVYPRFVHLKEWDIAAGVAIVNATGGSVIEVKTKQQLTFNSERLEAPYFIAKRKRDE